MTESAEDVARESIESNNDGDFDRLPRFSPTTSTRRSSPRSAASRGPMPGSTQRSLGSKRFQTSTAR